jgi:hypothetical protein
MATSRLPLFLPSITTSTVTKATTTTAYPSRQSYLAPRRARRHRPLLIWLLGLVRGPLEADPLAAGCMGIPVVRLWVVDVVRDWLIGACSKTNPRFLTIWTWGAAWRRVVPVVSPCFPYAYAVELSGRKSSLRGFEGHSSRLHVSLGLVDTYLSSCSL